ncbi:nucleoside phosphorylase domain-containing protein [Xylogone sp. PMI_703]|nr:nucleoside phosphorylase domain-containing protein [Xylogone sp. PMI_703]
MAQLHRPLHRKDFEIAVICALPIERDAIEALLDKEYEIDGFSYGKASGDLNAYTTGRIGNHSVVLAYLPGIGKASSAAVASGVRISFEGIKLGIVVGICGGAPKTVDGTQTEILLGDIIVSEAVIQTDFGRQYPNKFVRKDTFEESFSRANPEIRSFLRRLQGWLVSPRLRERTANYAAEVCKKDGFHRSAYPGIDSDKLYPANYRHKHQKPGVCPICDGCQSQGDDVCEAAINSSCVELGCDERLLMRRGRVQRARGLNSDGTAIMDVTKVKEAQKPSIHFGRIASSDAVLKSGQHRDEIVARENVIAFEMESAGLWDYLPTVVIKGVCDYADSHKNKAWQGYAAATAAACMKAFLEEWRSTNISSEESTALETPSASTIKQRHLSTSGDQTEHDRCQQQDKHSSNAPTTPMASKGGLEPFIQGNRSYLTDIFGSPTSPETILEKCRSLAQHRKLWNPWPEDSSKLLQTLQYWISTPSSSLLVMSASPSAEKRARDLAVQIALFLKERTSYKTIWSFTSHYTHDSTVSITDSLKTLIFQALRDDPTLLSSHADISQCQLYSTETELFNLFSIILSKLSKFFVIIEVEDSSWKTRFLQLCQSIVTAPGSAVKILIVNYVEVPLLLSNSPQNNNRILNAIIQQPPPTSRKSKSLMRLNNADGLPWQRLNPSF